MVLSCRHDQKYSFEYPHTFALVCGEIFSILCDLQSLSDTSHIFYTSLESEPFTLKATIYFRKCLAKLVLNLFLSVKHLSRLVFLHNGMCNQLHCEHELIKERLARRKQKNIYRAYTKREVSRFHRYRGINNNKTCPESLYSCK